MPEDEHRITIVASRCGREGCECEKTEDYEGTVQEAVQRVNDESYERDEYILEIIALQQQQIETLAIALERFAFPAREGKADDLGKLFGNCGSKLN